MNFGFWIPYLSAVCFCVGILILSFYGGKVKKTSEFCNKCNTYHRPNQWGVCAFRRVVKRLKL